MKRFAFVLLIGVLTFTIHTASAAEDSLLLGVGAKPVFTTLDNGVAVGIIEDHQAPVVALRVYVHTGSLHEGKLLGAGVSHFLEHLVAGGSTGKRTEAESQKLLDSIGAQANAYTTRDHTCYHMTTASRFFDTALDLLADWTTNSSIAQEEWDREYEVIQREMERRNANPRVILAEAGDQILFKVFPARVPVIGYLDAFRALTRDDVYGYYKKTYRPDNLLVVVAGDVSSNDALAKIRAAFGAMPHLAAEPIVLPEEPRQLAPRRNEVEMPAGQAHMTISWRTIPLSHPDLYPLDTLSYILSAGESSRLVRVIRDELHLVNSIGTSSYTPSYDGGEFTVFISLDPANIEAAEKAVIEQIQLVREELVTEEAIAKAKRQKISEHVFGLQTVEAKAGTLGSDILSAYDPEFSYHYAARIQETTAEEIRDAARRYLLDDRICIAVVKPPMAAQEAGAADAQQGEAEEVRKLLLPNGITLLLRRDPSLPIVTIQVYFSGGLRLEPEGLNGLAAFTARMLTRGTVDRTAAQIAEAFDRMGGGIGGSSGNNSIFLAASCLAENADEAMGIFLDVLMNPSFPEAEIESERPRFIAAAESRKDDWESELSDAFRERWFESHPYRYSTIGTPETLKAITRADMVAFHDKNMVPTGGVMAVYGDIEPDRIVTMINERLGNKPLGLANRKEFPPEQHPEEDVTVRIEGKRDIGGVFIGYPGMTFADVKDRYAMDVLDSLTSGIGLPRGWLHETLRGKGLVYLIHAYNFVGVEPGFFGIYAGCEPQKVDEVKELILQQIGRLFTDEIPEEDLRAARQTCLTTEVLGLQTNADRGMSAALDEIYGQGYDHAREYEEGIMAVTADDLRRVAKKYLTHYLCILMTPGAEAKMTEGGSHE
jgi:zinc protease